jgi:alanine dehydrogenase
MTLITGIAGTSRKENEHRLPIHPQHLGRIPEALRPHLRFERGYGRRFGLSAAELETRCGGLLERDELLAACDLVVLPKVMPEDLLAMREGAVHWGWPHCVQQREITQAAIDRRLTLIAFEAMYHWLRSGARGVHSFSRNNELAGYCGVLHAFELLGIDGHYGPRRRAAVLGFGAVSRGAVYALQGRGVFDITAYTQRSTQRVRDRIFGCRHLKMRRSAGGRGMKAVLDDGTSEPLADHLARADVIVNGTLQDPQRPLMYLGDGEVERLKPGCLIVDVSCDLGMGFPFARPTSFEDPIFEVQGGSAPRCAGPPAIYYGVDHTPSYLWDAATWEISEGLLPYLPAVMEGPEGWARIPALERAVEIRDGVVRNPTILSFQGREEAYPHRVRGGA